MDQSDSGSTTASEGGEAERKEEHQRVRDVEELEPEDRLVAHFAGSRAWTVAQLPQFIGGLYYIPVHSELWMLRLGFSDQHRRAHSFYSGRTL